MPNLNNSPKVIAAPRRTLEQQATYLVALAIVDRLEPNPASSKLSRNLYSRDGRLLPRLWDVVEAYQAGELATGEELERAA